jgi:hypothetical protein
MPREAIVIHDETARSGLALGEWSMAKESKNSAKHDQQHHHPASSLHTPQRTRVIEVLIDLYQTDAMRLSHNSSLERDVVASGIAYASPRCAPVPREGRA